MLKNIILVLSGLYMEKVKKTPDMDALVHEMEKNNYTVRLVRTEDVKQICSDCHLPESLFVSDSGEVLAYLNDLGGYGIACYHDGTTGLMGCTQYAIEGISGMDVDYMEKVYQRYCKIPWNITETKRCRIREMGTDDLADLYELYADKQITAYTEDLFSDRDFEKCYIEDYIENVYKYFGFGTWLIHSKENGRLIGRAGFNFRAGYDEAELGFVIAPSYWRQGYAYEVCSRLLFIGKTVFEFEKIQALVDRENMASVCLLKKLGFYYVEDVTVDGRKYQRYLYE